MTIRLPDFVIDIIDPAGRYLRNGRPRPDHRNLPRRFAAYTPVGGKPRTPNPEQRQRLLASRPPRPDRIPIDEGTITATAAELAAGGQATVRDRSVRLVRFWHGDAVLDVGDPGNRQRTRIPRRALRDRGSLRAELARHLRNMIS